MDPVPTSTQDQTQSPGNYNLLLNLPLPVQTQLVRSLDDTDLSAVSLTSHRGYTITQEERDRRRHLDRKMRLLQYGAGAPKLEYELQTPAFEVTELLGEAPNWHVTYDAMVLVARTFGGAFSPERERYSQFYPADWESRVEFQKVRDWWLYMCAHNSEVAFQTDLLAFILFTGEFIKNGEFQTDDTHVQFSDEWSKFIEGLRDLPVEVGLELPSTRYGILSVQTPIRHYFFNRRDTRLYFRNHINRDENNIDCGPMPGFGTNIISWAKTVLETIETHFGSITSMQPASIIENPVRLHYGAPSLFTRMHFEQREAVDRRSGDFMLF